MLMNDNFIPIHYKLMSMYRLLALLLISICFLNTFDSGAELLLEGISVESSHGAVSHKQSISSLEMSDNADSHFMSHCDDCNSGDASKACTHCHLGHCPFTVGSFHTFVALQPKEKFLWPTNDTYFGSYVSNPLRPPRS